MFAEPPPSPVLEPVVMMMLPEDSVAAVPDFRTIAPEPPAPLPSLVIRFASPPIPAPPEAADIFIEPPVASDESPPESKTPPAVRSAPVES
jgi:hypothetical protein